MGILDPVGLEASPAGDLLFLVDGLDPSSVLEVGSDQHRIGSVRFSEPASPSGFAYDSTVNELVAVMHGAAGIERLPLATSTDPLGHRALPVDAELGELLAAGFAIDRGRDVAYGVDGNDLLVLGLEPASGTINGVTARHDLGTELLGPARGLSVDPATGQVYVGDAEQVLVVDSAGIVTRVLDLSAVGVTDLRDLAVAASFDTDDAADTLSLYALHERAVDGPALVELSTAPPAASATRLAGTDTAVLVQVIAGSSLTPVSPDSAGLTYMPTNGHLLMSDSEVNEYGYYTGVNLWQFTAVPTVFPDGVATIHSTGTTADPPGSSSDRWSDEPTGITIDQDNNRIFTTDDTPSDPGVIYEVDLGADGDAGTADDTEIRAIGTAQYGSCDPEGITFDTARGWLHVACGTRGVISVDPGVDGTFGTPDDVASPFDPDGVSDAEGIAYNAVTDTLTVIDYSDTTVGEFTPGGTFIRNVDISAGGPAHPAGATWAPSSLGSGQSLWVVDRATDGSSPVDGKIFEYTVPGLTPGPDIRVGPSPLAFGTKVIGAGPFDLVTTVTNVGTTTLTVTSADLSSGGPEFSVVSGGGGPFTVASGATHDITVRFDPTGDGPFAGNLRVESDDPDSPTVDVSLSGTAVQPNIVVTPAPPGPVGFGSIQVGTLSESTVNIANTGTADLDVSSTSVSGSVAFSIDADTGGPFTLSPAENRDVTVRFSPTALIGYAGTFTVASDDPDSPSIDVTLTGTGVAQPVPDISVPPTADLGSIAAGDTADATVTVTNEGSADLTVSATTTTGAFSVVAGGAPFTVASGATHDVTVRFAPTTAGSFTGDLSIISNDPDESPADVSLSGTATSGTVAGPCPSPALPFGDVSTTSIFYADIQCIFGLNITTGTTANTYSPGDLVTREQMASFLARTYSFLAGVTCPTPGIPFLDVFLSSVHYFDVRCIFGLGITTGTGPTTYSPADFVTREQMAAFIARLYAAITGSAYPIISHPFSDVPLSSLFSADIGRIFNLGITTGSSATTYTPAGFVTREQMAAFIARLIRILGT
ncbi:MAG: choice-of-anchor D domain-containing protein, partial [Acidimicrobiales bacterium]